MTKYSVIIIDMLNDFVTGELKTDRAQRIIPNLKRLVEAARKSFFDEFMKLKWELFPDTLSCIWIAPKKRLDYLGRKSVI